jgi:hypothetical protein
MSKSSLGLCLLAWSMVGCAVQPAGEEVAQKGNELRRVPGDGEGDPDPLPRDPVIVEQPVSQPGKSCHVESLGLGLGMMGDNGWCCGYVKCTDWRTCGLNWGRPVPKCVNCAVETCEEGDVRTVDPSTPVDPPPTTTG